MIKRCKRDWAMIRYGYALKVNVACVLIFMAIGLLSYFLSGGLFYNGAYFAMLAPTFLVQTYSTNSVALMVQASPRKKAMQTVDVAVYSGASVLVIYLVLAVVPWLQHKGALPTPTGWEPETILFSQFWLAAFGVLILLYTAAAYKAYWVSVVLMVIAMMIFFDNIGGGGSVRPEHSLAYKGLMAVWPFGYAQTVALGSAVILAGTLLAYLLGRLLYRRPMSKAAHSPLMRKMMNG